MKTIEQTIQNVFERASNENQRKARRNKIIKTAISCLCIALMICVGCIGLIGNNPESDDYYILIDVNPSIEIKKRIKSVFILSKPHSLHNFIFSNIL